MLLTPKPNALLGIDISPSAVKLVELITKGNKKHIAAFARASLPSGAMVDGQIADVEAVGDAIRKALRHSGSKTRNAALAIPGSAAITKTITMPADLSDDELEQQIQLEADQHVPYPVDDVYLDFEVIGPNANDAEVIDVLLVAARTETVDNRVAAAEIAGLNVSIMDIEPYALEIACNHLLGHQVPDNGNGKTVALFDIGSHSTDITVLHDQHAVYSRDQEFGGEQLTHSVSMHYGISLEEAQEQISSGTLAEADQDTLLRPFVDDISQQVNRNLQFFFSSSHRYDHVDQVLLAGGCSRIPGLADRVSQHIGINVATIDPFHGMSQSSKARANQIEQQAPALLLASGLALRALD